MTENKENITFEEFRTWLVGLIAGKRGVLPDLEDWKMIKKKMDSVVPEKEVVVVPSPFTQNPPPFGPDPHRYLPFEPESQTDEAWFHAWTTNHTIDCTFRPPYGTSSSSAANETRERHGLPMGLDLLEELKKGL